jgi:hypothetical protein
MRVDFSDLAAVVALLLSSVSVGCVSGSHGSASASIEPLKLGWSESEMGRGLEAWAASMKGHGLEKTASWVPPALPADGVVVHAKVVKVDRPLLAQSLVGDQSTAILELVGGSVPGRPGLTRIVMAFDSNSLRAALEVGQTCALQFTRDGAFFGYDMRAPVAPVTR